MMHGRQKSDLGVVALKLANKPGRPGAESVEQRPGAKGNTVELHTHRTQSRAAVSQRLDRVRQAARQRKKEKFTALLHHLEVDLLRDAFSGSSGAAPGVDGVSGGTTSGPGDQARPAGSSHRGTYRALPSGDGSYRSRTERGAPGHCRAGRQDRPARSGRGVERDLRGRLPRVLVRVPAGRSQHDALDALWVGIMRTRVNWILDADIRSFFDRISPTGCCGSWGIGSATSASSVWCASGSRRASWKTGGGAG